MLALNRIYRYAQIMISSDSKLYIIAHNIRSAYNIGAIFRTADGMGANKVLLTGYSPDPHDGTKILQTSAQRMIAKTALGAEKTLPWEKREDIFEMIAELKGQGFMIVALEQDARSMDYRSVIASGSVALIVGNEPAGMEREVIATCDAVMEIPMRGQKNSLNVAVALGIAGYALYDKIPR